MARDYRHSDLLNEQVKSASQNGLVDNAAQNTKQMRESILRSGYGDGGMGDAASYYASATEKTAEAVHTVARGAKSGVSVGVKGVKTGKSGVDWAREHSKMSKGGVSRQLHGKQLKESLAGSVKQGAKNAAKGTLKAPGRLGKRGIKAGMAYGVGAVENLDQTGLVSGARTAVSAGKAAGKAAYKTSSAVVRSPYTATKFVKRTKNTINAFRKGGLRAGIKTFRNQRKARRLQKYNRKASQLAKRGLKAGAKGSFNLLKLAGGGFKAAVGAVGGLLGAAAAPVIGVCLVIVLAMTLITITATSKKDTGSLEGDQAVIAAALKGFGFNNAQTAAIMSNMCCESGYCSRRYQGGAEYEYLNELLKSRAGGYGLCQWDGGRKRALCDFCDSNGVAHSDINKQCEWLNNEVNTGTWSTGRADAYVGYFYWDWNTWKSQADSAENVENLSKTWTWQFERCAASAYANRLNAQIEEANRVYSALVYGGLGNEVVVRAANEKGKPYQWGGAGPDGYDCSGLVAYALTGQHSHRWTTYDYITWSRTDNPMPGDVCTTSEHCGIYIGNGKMIHAPQTGDVVKESNVQAGMIYVKYGG